jgi:hypothetical protein
MGEFNHWTDVMMRWGVVWIAGSENKRMARWPACFHSRTSARPTIRWSFRWMTFLPRTYCTTPRHNLCHLAPILDRRTPLLECLTHFNLHNHFRRPIHLSPSSCNRTAALSLSPPRHSFLFDLEQGSPTPPLLSFPDQLPATGTFRSPLMASKTLARAIPGTDDFEIVRAKFYYDFATSTGLGTVACPLFVALPEIVARTLPLSVCMFIRSSNCIHLLAARP